MQREADITKTDPPPSWLPWNVNGTQRLAVICVEFSDVTHYTNTSTIQTRLSNMAKYFHDISLGKIRLDFTLFSDNWMKLNNTMEYYGQGSWNNDVHGWDFMLDSINAWQTFVNFSKYDYLAVIHAGKDQASNTNETELLWSRDFGNLGHDSKLALNVGGNVYRFWGVAYESEYDEYGIIAHEFGHGLGLPDLYVENETLAFDPLSLMADGEWNGSPQGTSPAPLDGFSMYLVGWLSPTTVELNSTERVLEIKGLGSDSPTVLKVPISETEYYMIELRENSGYDEYSVPSTSIIVYLIDETKESEKGIATLSNGGIVTQGSVYSDAPRNIFVSFLSFNSSTHVATLGFSTRLFFVRINVPDSMEWLSTASGQVQVFDTNNNPARYVPLNITVDENSPLLRVTDQNGKTDFPLSFSLNELGNHTIRVTSPSMLAGQTETVIAVFFPWQPLAIALLSIGLAVLVIEYLRARKRYKASVATFWF